MEHEQAQALFSAQQDGELADEQAAALQAHLQCCARCRAEWESFRDALALVRELPRPAAPDDFLEGVQRKIRSRSKGAYFRVKAVRPFVYRLPFELFSLLMILVLVALMVLQATVARVRPIPESDVRLQRPGGAPPAGAPAAGPQGQAPQGAIAPGSSARAVLPVKREAIRYRYRVPGAAAELRLSVLGVAEGFGAERQIPDDGRGLRLVVPAERFKDFTAKLLEGLTFKVERERFFAASPPAGVEVEIQFER